MTAPVPQPGLMDIAPYIGGESVLPGVSRVIKLASNEGALGASPKAMEAYRNEAERLYLYPDGSCAALRAAIGDRYRLDPERIVCGAGSDELLGLLIRSYAGAGDEVLYNQHGFLMYPIAARAAGATPVAAPDTADLAASVDSLLAAVSPRTTVVVLANPANPSGTYLPHDEIARLRAGLPEHVLLILDAAYAEFVGRNDYAPGSDLVDSGNNTVMTRTFSKIHGMGGLRLGWAYCPAAIADVLNRARGPFNVSNAAQAAGCAAIGDTAFETLARTHNDYWLAWTVEQLHALGFPTTPSVCNFVLAHMPENATRTVGDLDAFLRGRGIIVRLMAAYSLPRSFRITIGRDDEMRALIAALADFVEQTS